MKGGPKFRNFASELPTHPLWGNFVICDMGHVKIYLCSKFDVSDWFIGLLVQNLMFLATPQTHELNTTNSHNHELINSENHLFHIVSQISNRFYEL